MTERAAFDVLIVGARCAGAGLAAFLARAGASVLIIDKAPMPSDQVLSTHTIHPPGMDILDELGVGAAVRERCPSNRVMRLRKGASHVDIPFGEGRDECCPRRARLDALIQGAAVAAGAELRDRTRLVDVLFDGDRVVGARLQSQGDPSEVRASLVVGADGRHSTVARAVKAEEYLGYDAPRGMYWSYWDTPDVWRDESCYPFDMFVGNVDGDVRVIFQTDDDQLLIGALPAVEQAETWSKNAEVALLGHLKASRVTAPLVAEAPPTEPVRGVVKERYFFREAAGPGWALVGDAGHHKEFIIGDGITEALIQARSLARTIGVGTDEALARWWRERDIEALPLFFFGREEGLAGPPLRIQEHVIAAVGKRPDVARRMAQTMEHELSPYEAIGPLFALRCAFLAALRGEPGCLREFLVMGRRAARFGRELATRKKLAEQQMLPASTAHAA